MNYPAYDEENCATWEYECFEIVVNHLDNVVDVFVAGERLPAEALGFFQELKDNEGIGYDELWRDKMVAQEDDRLIGYDDPEGGQ